MKILDLSQATGTPWLKNRIIYLTKHGSQAYGTNIATSDLDIKGVAIPPKEYFLGFNKSFEQAEFRSPDAVIFDIRKFLSLAADCNPNVIEILNTDDADVLYRTPQSDVLRHFRHLFLSKKAKHTFSGYAVSQLKRIEGHYRWLKNPPAKKPERKDFGLPEARSLIPPSERDSIEAAIKKYTDSHRLDLSYVDDTVRIQAQRAIEDYMLEIGVASGQQSGIDPLWYSGAQSLGLTEEMQRTLLAEKRYSSALKDYQAYENWKAKRNPDRAAIEEKYGYDCYTDDTEFLTDKGWRLFDEIGPEDSVATVDRNDFTLEYQKPTQRFDGLFNGNLHRFYGNHLEVTVTPNHRMLYRKVERASGKEHEWGLEEAAGVPDCFDFRTAIAPNRKNFCDKKHYEGQSLPPDAYATLMGWYLSDGSAAFRNGTVDSIRISQKKGGKLSWKMARFAGDYGATTPMSVYEYERPPNAFNSNTIIERVLAVSDKGVVSKLYGDCGHGSFEKRIPRWMFGQSKRIMEKLLFALIGGDGTVRPRGTYIYYSASKKLADDVQELAFMCGWETSLYGPYENNGIQMYQVHLNNKASPTKRLVRNQNLELVPVIEQRIVCFSVPNGTLVTRKKGHVAIQGNCKHAMHLVRLMRMCEEILHGKGVIVRRPDREELLSIRHGAWTYEQLIDWASNKEKELEELYKTSKLPSHPDKEAIDKLCIKLVESSFQTGTDLESLEVRLNDRMFHEPNLEA